MSYQTCILLELVNKTHTPAVILEAGVYCEGHMEHALFLTALRMHIQDCSMYMHTYMHSLTLLDCIANSAGSYVLTWSI